MVLTNASGRFALACLLALSLGAAATPAFAFDEGRGSTLDTIMSMFGMSGEKEDPTIDYRTRAPLVLPPRTELRQPKAPASKSTANWPQDQEITAARKKLAANDRTRLNPNDRTTDFQPRGLIANPAGLTPARPTAARACDMDTDNANPNKCSPEVFWNNLKVTSAADDIKEIRAGEEPDRKFLTQPPKGFLKPTKTQKATFEAPRSREEERPSDFFLKTPKQDE